MILGLDISSNCTGYCVLGKDKKRIESGAIRTPKRKNIEDKFDKAKLVEEKLKEIKEKYDITDIFIEQPLDRVQKGFGSAKTIGVLWYYNGLISQQCVSIFGLKPSHIPPKSARKRAGLKVKKGVDVKEAVLKFILELYSDVTPELNRNNNIATHNYDMADSIIVALAGWDELREKTEAA